MAGHSRVSKVDRTLVTGSCHPCNVHGKPRSAPPPKLPQQHHRMAPPCSSLLNKTHVHHQPLVPPKCVGNSCPTLQLAVVPITGPLGPKSSFLSNVEKESQQGPLNTNVHRVLDGGGWLPIPKHASTVCRLFSGRSNKVEACVGMNSSPGFTGHYGCKIVLLARYLHLSCRF